jgi:hypothetical protein
MSKLLPTSVQTIGRNIAHPTNLATTKMGYGSSRPTATFARRNKFAMVVVEYFTRWISAKPLATITSESIKKFFWQNIVCRFRVPRSLTLDNGKQFN